MTDVRLTDEQWRKIRGFLLEDPNAYVGKDEDACRRFVEAVKWVSRSGTVATAPQRIRLLEHNLQTLHALV